MFARSYFCRQSNCTEGSMAKVVGGLILAMACASLLGAADQAEDAPPKTIEGYVRDSGCVHRFHEVVKPLPNGCLEACVRAGSPACDLEQERGSVSSAFGGDAGCRRPGKIVAVSREAREGHWESLRARRIEGDCFGTRRGDAGIGESEKSLSRQRTRRKPAKAREERPQNGCRPCLSNEASPGRLFHLFRGGF